jgi:hypothetical protein
MKAKVIRENTLAEANLRLTKDVQVGYFKIVGIGPNTIESCEGNVEEIRQILVKQPGFFILSDSQEDMRETLHQLVDKFCDALEVKTS